MSLLSFSNKDATYLILNIIAHDVIHDYGPGSTEKRWSDVQKYAKQFSNDYKTFSMPTLGGGPFKTFRSDSGSSVMTIPSPEEEPMELRRKNPVSGFNDISPLSSSSYSSNGSVSEPRRFLRASRPTRPQITNENPGNILFENISFSSDIPEDLIITPEDEIMKVYDCLQHYIGLYTNFINNGILFSFFIFYVKMVKMLGTDFAVNYNMSDKFIVPIDNETEELTYLYDDICSKFKSYCLLRNVPHKLTYVDFLNLLSVFLQDDYVIMSIYENFDYELNENVGGNYKKKHIKTKTVEKNKKGGAKKDESLSLDECKTIISETETLLNNEIINSQMIEMNNIYTNYKTSEGQITDENKQKYETNRKDIIQQFQKIFNKYNQTKISGGLYGNETVFPLIKIRFTKSRIDLITNFKEYIEKCLIKFRGVIAEDDEVRRKIEEREEADRLAAEKGDLTSEDKKVRQDFVTFIAKSGLYLTNCCDKNGIVNKAFNSLNPKNALRKEINILLYQADWNKKQDANSNWGDVKSQDLDTQLITYFYENYKQINDSVCSKNGNYVINNAAPLPASLKKLSLCPYTSILDGMSQCSWKSAQGNIEYGDMDFKILNTDNQQMYYNGTLKLIPNKNEKYPLFVNISLDINTPITRLNNTKKIGISGSDLEAHYVLKNTLISMINYILNINAKNKKLLDRIFNGNKIFDNFFDICVEDVSLFGVILNEILFKGVGDLFQEINSVCKKGGYVNGQYKIDKNILPINTVTGNQLRYFAANDRPSGSRFIFMLMNGNVKEINIKAVGGYVSGDNTFIVKHPMNNNVCSIEMKGKKGGSLNKRNVNVSRIKTKKQKNYKRQQREKYTRKNRR